MEKRICVAAVGDNCMDCYDDLGQSFPGGNPVNVAVYIRRLGGQAPIRAPLAAIPAAGR